MSVLRYTLLTAIFTAAMLSSSAQDIGGLLNKVKKKADQLTASLAWEPGKAVSTSVKDTLPGLYWLNSYMDGIEPDTVRTFDLSPGYYRDRIRSYCLHAGTFGPSKGSGYQIASFKGTQRTLITSLLARSVQHPEISQGDIQTLIWGIEAGQRFTQYPKDFQLRVKQLLTLKEIALMEVNTDKISGELLPDEVEKLLGTYASLRRQMQSAQMDYDRLEEVAVLTGAPPSGAGSVNIDPGKWSYLNSGYFVSADPEGYRTTDLQLYRPAPVEVTYDQQGRISGYRYDGSHVQINYKDNGITFKVGKHTAHQQTLQSYTISDGSGASQTVPVDVKYVDWGMDITNDILRGAQDLGLHDIVRNNTGLELDVLQNGFDNIKKWKNQYNDLKGLHDDFNLDKAPPENLDKYINDAAINEMINDGLKVSLNPLDKKGQSQWIKKSLRMTLDFFFYSICKLRGDDCRPDDNPRKPGLQDYVAQPGNTSRQRLGLSEFTK